MRWIDLQLKSIKDLQCLRSAVVMKHLQRIAAFRRRIGDEEPRVVVVGKVRCAGNLSHKVLRARLGLIAETDWIELIGTEIVARIGSNIDIVLDLFLIISDGIESTHRISC